MMLGFLFGGGGGEVVDITKGVGRHGMRFFFFFLFSPVLNNSTNRGWEFFLLLFLDILGIGIRKVKIDYCEIYL